MYMFYCLTKASVIELKEFIVKSLNYLGQELNVSNRPSKPFGKLSKSFNEQKPVRETYLKDSIFNEFNH